MTKLAIALLLMAVLLIAHEAPQAGNKDKQPNDAGSIEAYKAQEEHRAQPSPILQQFTDRGSGKKEGQGETAQPINKPHDWIDGLNAFSTCIIAVFTALLFCGVIRQIRTSRDIERAWIIGTPVECKPELGILSKQGGMIPINVFDVAIKNVGHTPAHLIDIVNNYIQVESLNGLPETPEYGKAADLSGITLVPQDSIANRCVLQPKPTLTDDMHPKIIHAERFLYAFGRVRYKDVFGNVRETKWGYVYDFPQGIDISIADARFQRAGPRKYNSAT